MYSARLGLVSIFLRERVYTVVYAEFYCYSIRKGCSIPTPNAKAIPTDATKNANEGVL